MAIDRITKNKMNGVEVSLAERLFIPILMSAYKNPEWQKMAAF